MEKNEDYYQQLESEYINKWGAPVEEEGEVFFESSFRATKLIGGIERAGEENDEEVIVAEGDSWFNYGVGRIRAGRDILHNLTEHYKIIKVAKAGDTLENMVYGTSLNLWKKRKRPSWEKTCF